MKKCLLDLLERTVERAIKAETELEVLKVKLKELEEIKKESPCKG